MKKNIKKYNEFINNEKYIFEEITTIIDDEIFGISDTNTIFQNENISKLIDMGESIIPLLINKIKTNSSIYDYYILENIISDCNIPNLEGDYNAYQKYWINWWESNKNKYE